MKIYKVLVDELPESCYKCEYRQYIEGCRIDHNFCLALPIDNNDIKDPHEGRMSWCPLVIEDMCEWIIINYPKKHQQSIFDDVNTSCGNSFYSIELKDYWYCPSCGKKVNW